MTSTSAASSADGVPDGGAAATAAAGATVDAGIADAGVAAASTHATSATADRDQVPALNAAVLQMLDNDIATPTRGQAWKIYCKM